MAVRVAVLYVYHVYAVLQLVHHRDGILLAHVCPIGVDFQLHIGAGLYLLVNVGAVLIYLELVRMVVVAQLDALGGEHGLYLVDQRDELVQLLLSAQIGARDYDELVADGLVVLDGLLKSVLGQLLPAGVGGGNLHAALVQLGLYLLGGNAEEARKLGVVIAQLAYLFQSAQQVALRRVAHGIHLQTVFHDLSPPLYYA